MKLNLLHRDILHSSTYLLILALIFSSFTFLWNPLGFPPLKYGDGTYTGRAMHVLVARNPQVENFYDHPYFGQLFLAGILWITGYPDSIHPTAKGDVLTSVQLLWLVPKLFIGILGVIDTFLIFKIGERRYNAKVGFIASILFAIMSISLLRTIFLESLQLPFLLSSIFFALNAMNPKTRCNEKRYLTNVLISGIFMGLAIFTKIPAFTMIPLVVFLILTSNKKKLKTLGFWMIPVALIPLIWPMYAISQGQFDQWLNGIYWQTHRQTVDTLEEDRQKTLVNSITTNFMKMPVLFGLGLSGLVFAALKKDFFLLLWAIPFLGFLYAIGFASEFHIIPLLPLLCISSSRFIVGLAGMINYKKIGEILPFFIISFIAILGLVNVLMQLIANNNDNRFLASAFVTRYLNDNKDGNITMIANNVYLWIPKYVFQMREDYRIPEIDPLETSPKINKSLFVVDGNFKSIMSANDETGKRLLSVYNMFTNNETATVQIGPINIILPENRSSFSGLIKDNGTDLLSREFSWKLKGTGHISRDDDTLKVLVKTNGTDKVTRNVILRTQLKNLTETPLLLSVVYNSKSPERNDRFFVEIKDPDSPKRYFKNNLSDTSGNETSQMYILPGDIADKPTEFRFGITTNTPGEHTLMLKTVRIISKL